MLGPGQIDRRSFWISLILAPFALGLLCLVLTLVGMPLIALLDRLDVGEEIYWPLFLIVVPLYALIFGLPSYFLFGGPVYWWLLKRGELRWWAFALAGVVANLATPLAALVLQLGGEVAWMMLAFGSAIAPLWSLVFILLYRRRTRHLRPQDDLEEVFG